MTTFAICLLAQQTWLSMLLPVVLSLLACALATLLYLWLKRRTVPHVRKGKSGAGQRLLMGISVLLLLLVILVYIWRGQARWIDQIDQWVHTHRLHSNILWTLVAVVMVVIIGRIVELAIIRRATDLESKHKARRAVLWIKTIVLVIWILVIWVTGVQQFGLFLGFLGAGLALSLQEILLCIAGWILIVIKKLFDVGDRIEISGHVGDVIDIGMFQTSVLEVGNWVGADQSTGRILNVPNSAVFRGFNANYTRGFPFIWNEQTIVVTFESDWKLAKEIISKQAEEEADKIENEVRRQIEAMQSRYAIRYTHLKPIVYTHIADQGVALTLRYLCPARRRRNFAHLINEGILEDFARENSIAFAYPTTRFYDALREGGPTDHVHPPATGVTTNTCSP